MAYYLLIVVGIYMIFQTTFTSTSNALSKLFFKFVPMMLAIACLMVAVIKLNLFGILN
ncbi:hypothetical protein [Enterococcus casseliflavus]|uniref:hypothetical protein n=1 Tax=Enterococcus TaxID=1350 RepID=UPI000B6BAC45|nr:hypothetical protein A5882_003482 [Enterococcus sp. 4E1_DIV0656]